MTQKFRIVGVNDDQTTCLLCGREELKRVVWLVALDADGNPEGTPGHYGTSCAARMLGWSHATSAATKRKVEVEGIRAAEATIGKACDKVRAAHCELHSGMFYVLREDVAALAHGTMTPKEAVAKLRKAHPITRWYDGTMKRDVAFKLALEILHA